MLKYCAKRLLQSIVTIFIVISIVFLLLRLMPITGYFDAGTWGKLSWDVKLNTLQQLGLYDANGQPINPFVQLFNFYKQLFTSFDFGVSTKVWKGIAVTEILSSKIPYSLAFGTVSTIFILIFGYTIGIFQARFKEKAFDRFFMGYIVFFASVPAIVSYFLLQIYITQFTGWQMVFKVSIFNSWFTPVIIAVITGVTGPALWLRRYTVDQLNSDYVKLAYAKGLPSNKIMFRHVLRNAFVPMAYGLPGAFILTVSGSILIEQLFAIPGMGYIMIKAVRERDNNLAQVIVFLYTALGILAVFLGDLLVMLVDPRITLDSKGGTRR